MPATDPTVTAGAALNPAATAFVEQSTAGLAGDPELQREVRQELAAHLQDSAAEFERAGFTPADAAAESIRSIGDSATLGRDLLTANRPRMRARAITQGVMRLVVAPAAAIATGMVAWQGLLALGVVLGTISYFSGAHNNNEGYAVLNWSGGQTLVERLRKQVVERATSGDKGVLQLGSTTDPEVSRPVAESNPDHVGIWAEHAGNLASLWLSQQETMAKFGDAAADMRITLPPPREKVMAAIEHGQNLDPNNGYWAALRATVLFAESAEPIAWKDINGEDWRGIDLTDDGKKPAVYTFAKQQIRDPAGFDAAIQAVREAVSQPMIDSRRVEMGRRRVEAFAGLGGAVAPAMTHWTAVNTLLPDLSGYRVISNRLCGYAADRWAAGDRAAALEMLDLNHQYAIRLADGSRTIVEAWQAAAMDLQGHAARVWMARNGGGAEMESAALADHRKFSELMRSVLRQHDPSRDREMLAGRATLGAMVAPLGGRGVRWEMIDGSGSRWTEYALLDRVAVTLAGLGMLGIAAATMLRNGCLRWWSVPVPAVMDWASVARIVAWAVVLPAAAYGVYRSFELPSQRYWGLWVTWPRLVVEYALVGGVVAAMLQRLTWRWATRRSAELGLDAGRGAVGVGGPGGAIDGLLAAVGLGYVVAFALSIDPQIPERLRAFSLFAPWIALALLGWSLLRWTRPSWLIARLGGSTIARSGRGWTASIPTWVALLIPATAVVAGVVASLIGRRRLLPLTPGGGVELLLATTAVACGIVSVLLAIYLAGSELIASRRTARRSPVAREPVLSTPWAPMVAGAAVLVLIASPLLRMQENSAGRRALTGGPGTLTELEHSRFAEVRAAMLAEPQ